MTQPTIFAALAAVMNDVTSVSKGDNSGQGYSFRGIDAVLNAVGPALRKHKVIVTPMVEDMVSNVVEMGQRRTAMNHVQLTVRYVWHGPNGDCIEARVVAEAADTSDKATSKAMSIAFRTCLLQVLALPVADTQAISAQQLRMLMMLYKRAGMNDSADRHAYANALLDREIESSKDLSITEAGLLIDSLEQALAEEHREDPS
jgi:hypothetical protein